MSNTIATNILQYESMLREAGIPEKEAKAHARGTAMLMENSLATKTDLAKVESALKQDIALVRKDIMWIKIGGSILGAIIVGGFTLLAFLISTHH